jgi:hypothetical protein
VPVQKIFILPWLLWSAQYKIFFFLTVHYFNLFVPIAQQSGQAVVQSRLSLKVCLRSGLYALCYSCNEGKNIGPGKKVCKIELNREFVFYNKKGRENFWGRKKLDDYCTVY